jgi:lycopene beta-cyclase
LRFDYVLVGGGLQNALVALALRARQPKARLALVEKSRQLGGNHTWSFHEGDVAAASRAWLEPLVVHRWPGYAVAFPGLRRSLQHGYFSLTSEHLDALVRSRVAEASGSQVFLEAEATAIGSRRVGLRDGRELEAELVVDARGPQALAPAAGQGYQKFLGLELRLEAPAGPIRPTVMDATVPQTDGFHFVYTLPLAPERVLVEDTYYSDTPDLDAASLRSRVLGYAAQQGMQVAEVLREETGVLPIPWTVGESTADLGQPDRADEPLRAGYAGGFFHPTTGYSLPVAVRLAEHIASRPPEKARGQALDLLRREIFGQARFCRLLNWMLFCAYPPEQRFHVLERFYRLPEATIRRFYALELTLGDRARLLLGRPPAGLSLRAAFSRWQAA